MIAHSYGCRKDSPDSRDWKLSYSLSAPIPLPSKVNLIPKLPPCYNQYNLNSCVGNAVAAALQYLNMSYGNLSRLFLYYNGRLLEESHRVDQGMQIRSGVKAAAKYGACREEVWPYALPKVNTQPSDPSYQEAEFHQAINYYSIEQQESSIKRALAEGSPVIFGMVVYSSMESEEARRTGKVRMPKWLDRQQGRHAVLLVGYDDSTKEYIVRNSWGIDWGMKGNFTLPYDYVHYRKYCDDFWVIKEVEK